MERKSISVSCVGDTQFSRALRVVAGRKGVRVADVVRDAIDKSEYATEIKRELASFFESDAVLTPHSGVVPELESA